MTLLKSATKLVFIVVAITACVGFFLDKITNDQFIGLVMLVFAFYYRSNTTTSNTELKEEEKSI